MDERSRALSLALSQIERQFGRGSIMRLGERRVERVRCVSTGSLAVDIAIGIGGVPRGRVTEIFGQEASGKTTLSLHVIASAQKEGGVAAFIDAEHALDPEYARRIGVRIEELLISQPDTGEQALEIAETLVRSGAVDVVVIDSVAALVPRAELEGEMGEIQVGLQARLMSQALRKLTASISKSNTCAIFINQVRERVGIGWGNPEVTPGGRALKFYASLRLETRKVQTIKQQDTVVGAKVKVKVVKNKVAPPFREAEVDMLHNEGISWEADLLDTAVQLGVVQRSGAWYTYGEQQMGQGREQAKDFIRQNKDLASSIREAVLKRAGIQDARGKDTDSGG
jgi:recombination protein RecA